jgi:hypothetical protein
LRIRTWRS